VPAGRLIIVRFANLLFPGRRAGPSLSSGGPFAWQSGTIAEIAKWKRRAFSELKQQDQLPDDCLPFGSKNLILYTPVDENSMNCSLTF
jgi:hypothetical protein